MAAFKWPANEPWATRAAEATTKHHNERVLCAACGNYIRKRNAAVIVSHDGRRSFSCAFNLCMVIVYETLEAPAADTAGAQADHSAPGSALRTPPTWHGQSVPGESG